MHTARFALFLTVSLTILGEVDAQELNLGRVTLRVGTSQEQVLATLSEHFNVQKMDSTWWIQSKGAPPVRTLGYVTFDAGRLSSASKDWSPSDQEKGAELARAVYGALSSLAIDGTPCSLSRTDHQEPESTVQSVVVTCGAKAVSISILRVERKPDAAVVTEVIRRQP